MDMKLMDVLDAARDVADSGVVCDRCLELGDDKKCDSSCPVYVLMSKLDKMEGKKGKKLFR